MPQNVASPTMPAATDLPPLPARGRVRARRAPPSRARQTASPRLAPRRTRPAIRAATTGCWANRRGRRAATARSDSAPSAVHAKPRRRSAAAGRRRSCAARWRGRHRAEHVAPRPRPAACADHASTSGAGSSAAPPSGRRGGARRPCAAQRTTVEAERLGPMVLVARPRRSCSRYAAAGTRGAHARRGGVGGQQVLQAAAQAHDAIGERRRRAAQLVAREARRSSAARSALSFSLSAHFPSRRLAPSRRG